MFQSSTQPGICRVNHVSVALDFGLRNASPALRLSWLPVTLTGYDRDHDDVFFRYVHRPQEGLLTQSAG